MAKCDLCGGQCDASKLEQLRDSFQAAGVVDLCPPCVKWANKTKDDLLDEMGPRMRAAISERVGRRPGFWNRLKWLR